MVAKATACVVQDSASASFGASPFLIQHMTGHYGNISISTAGNQIRDAKGMKADIEIDDVRLSDTGNSKGTIGALDATITWSADGIKETIQKSIPLVGSFVNGVKTNPSDGTIELQGALGSIVAKPTVADHGIGLEVQKLTGLGFTLPRETVQPALDLFSTQLTKEYPLGIHADSVEVTDTGVIAKFSTRNATIPAGQRGSLLRRTVARHGAGNSAEGQDNPSSTARVPDSPSLVAPASSIASASAAVRMPPLALTPMLGPTVAAMTSTARTDAPPAG